MMRMIINLEVDLRDRHDGGYGEEKELVLMWHGRVLRRWPVDEGHAYVFGEKPHQYNDLIAEKLTEVFGGVS